MNLAVYTTYCGVTERSTFKPVPINQKYPHYLISNNDNYLDTVSKSFGYIPIFLDAPVSSCPTFSAKQSKVAKILPNAFKQLQEYDYLLYFDDKLSLNLKDIESTIETLDVMGAPIAMRRHQSIPNTNVLFDFAESMYQWRYRAEWETMVQYITEMIDAGYKLHSDKYFTTSVILRNMKHKDIIPINELWYEHTMKCSAVCQISFHFVRQIYKKVLTLPEEILNV